MLSLSLLAAATAVAVICVGSQRAQADDNDVEIKGLIANLSGTCPNLEFTVAGKRVSTHAGTEFDDGACANLRNGQRIEVDGVLQPNGALLAREVDQKP